MSRRYPLVVLLVFFVFFVISFLTNILGPLVPDLIDGFELSLGLAGFLPFAFFVAYGVMSIPAGMLLERYREKRVMVAAFALAFAGSAYAVEPREMLQDPALEARAREVSSPTLRPVARHRRVNSSATSSR